MARVADRRTARKQRDKTAKPAAPSKPALPVAPPARAISRRMLLHAALLGSCCALIYLSSPRPVLTWDTIPTRLVPFSLLRHGTVSLNEFQWLHHGRHVYFLRHGSHGELLSAYPLITALVATPLAVPAELWLRWNHVDVADVRFRVAAIVTEHLAASVIAAVSVGFVFLALCELTSPALAMVLALGYGLATNTWATSSQALWQHGLAELSLAGLSLCLVAPDTRRNAFVASVFAGLGVMARPTMAIFALAAAVFVWRERRAHAIAFVALPMVGTAALLAYNLSTLGHLFGGYRRFDFDSPHPVRLAGLLVSPNRGLFIYSPLTVLVLPAVAMWRRQHGWQRYAIIGVAGYLVLYMSFGGWWGGYTYGPRFLVDALPAIVLCMVPAVEWLVRSFSGRVLVAVLLLLGVVVQAIGAHWDDDSWNKGPPPLHGHSEVRLWDWSDLQIVRAVRAGWNGAELLPLIRQSLTDPRPALLQPLESADLAGTLAVEEPTPLHYETGQRGSLRLRLSNGGTAMWPSFSDYGFLQCSLVSLWHRDGHVLDDLVRAIPLPRNLGPGESMEFTATIQAPPSAGSYELELMLVQVMDVNKARPGATSPRIPVEVSVRRAYW